MTKKPFFLVLILFSLFSQTLRAESITIAAGAGYKRPIVEIIRQYEQTNGQHIDAVFGNMQQIISQTRMSGKVSMIFGEKSFFDQSGITFVKYYPVGEGRLVLAWRKGLHLKQIQDICENKITRVGIPDEKKAIYGHVAAEYLNNAGLANKVAVKLLVVSTVPQVSAYLVSGEIDAGFINVTDAIGIRDKIGGFVAADQLLYTPIHIQCGVIKGFEAQPEVQEFLQFLKSRESAAILQHYGI